MVVVMKHLVDYNHKSQDKRVILRLQNIHPIGICPREPAFGNLGNAVAISQNGKVHPPYISFHREAAQTALNGEFWPKEAKLLFHPGHGLSLFIDGVLRQKPEKLLLDIYQFLLVHIHNSKLISQGKDLSLYDIVFIAHLILNGKVVPKGKDLLPHDKAHSLPLLTISFIKRSILAP
jgi:hypothetical protein